MASSGSMYTSFARHRLVFEWNIVSQSVVNNTSTITGRLYLQSVDSSGQVWMTNVNSGSMQVNDTKRNFTATSTLNPNQKKLLFASNFTIPHDANGNGSFTMASTFDVGFVFNGVSYRNINVSGSATLNRINRTSSISISQSTINFGDKTRIHISRASSSFTHTLTFQWYGDNNTFANKINYVDFDFTPSIDLSRYIPNRTSGWGTIVCETYSGGTKIGSSSAKLTINTVNDSRFQPVINSVTISEANSSVTTAVGTVYVQSKSKLKVNTSASARMYSSISKIETKIGNTTYSGSSITSGDIDTSGSLNIVVTVTDSRGYKDTSSKTIDIVPYKNPTVNMSVIRRSDAQEIIDITWSGTSKAIGVDNTMGYKIEYQLANNSWILLEQNSSATQESWSGKVTKDSIDIDKVYNVRITMYDEFMSTVTNSTIPVSKVPMSWGTTGASVGKVFEEGGASFQIGGNMSIDGKLLIDIFYPVGAIFESTNSDNPSNFMGGTWERFGNGRVTVGVDEKDGTLNWGNKTVGSVNPLSYHTHQLKMILNGGSNAQSAMKYGIKFSGNESWRIGDLSEISSTSDDLPDTQTGAVAKGRGDNTNHNNWQPSISVYRWRRIA